jgi:hypothetical protein
MSGMFPDNQAIEIFGEQVQWPGVDENGKFTNGSFTDPMVKPSLIPAETINLILNNLEEFIKKCGGTPDSTTVLQLADLITSQPQANKIIQRDAWGRAQVAEPAAADDIARKAEVDAHNNTTTAIHGATDAATANRLIIREASGRAQVAAPAFDDDSLLIAPTKWVRENFNPRTVGDLVSFSYTPSAADMIRMRVLPLQGQVLPISQYQDLFNVEWSSAIQTSGDWWYKCTSSGTRDPNGVYFRVLDRRGLFSRAAGQNSKYKMADDAPYDGMAIGEFIGDAVRDATGSTSIRAATGGQIEVFGDHVSSGVFMHYLSNDSTPMVAAAFGATGKYMATHFALSLVVPTALENRPASVSAHVCIKY